MSPLSFFARHPRGDLSAYIDEQLSPSQRLTVESHLERCDSCRAEIAALTEARALLESLPQTAAPRSFALTPQQIAEPVRQRQPERAAPAFLGMRLASGLAAASLAVILVLDVSGGTSNDSGGGDDSGTVAELAAGSLDQERTSDGEAAPEADDGAGGDSAATSAATDSSLQALETPTLAPGSTPKTEASGGTTAGGVGGSAPTPAAGGVGGSGSGGSVGSTPAPPTGEVASLAPDDGAERDETATETPAFDYGDDMESPAPAVGALPSTTAEGQYNSTGEEVETTNADTLANSDDSGDNSDGLSALQIAEIVLAATLAVTVAGGFLVPFALRRNR